MEKELRIKKKSLVSKETGSELGVTEVVSEGKTYGITDISILFVPNLMGFSIGLYIAYYLPEFYGKSFISAAILALSTVYPIIQLMFNPRYNPQWLEMELRDIKVIEPLEMKKLTKGSNGKTI
jgi:hypothetical protein